MKTLRLCRSVAAATPAKTAGRGRRAGAAARGMTLLELLVALAIFAIIGGALYPVINGALSSRRDATERVALGAEARMILDRIEQDLVGNCDAGFVGPLPSRFVAAAPPSRDPSVEHVILETTTLTARGVTSADAFVGGEDVAALSVDRGDQAEVIWRIDASGRLLRQQVRPPQILALDWTKLPVEVLSEHATLVMEFYEPTTWLEAWDSGESGAHHAKAPAAVRTVVTVGKGDSALTLVSTVVLPVVQTVVDLRHPGGGGH